MMKRQFKVFLMCMAVVSLSQVAHAAGDVEINATNFPDENFRNYLLQQDYGKDGKLTEEEIKNITELDIKYKSISSLQGIEYFTALTKLDCFNNRLTALDVSKNTALTTLDCQVNGLTSLDVSENTALIWLYCIHNQLTSMDVSKNTALTGLWCGDNQLTSLDVSKNTALTRLECGENLLTSLDISNNTALTGLFCSNNQLTALDVSKNTALTSLYCDKNPLKALDVSKNTALTSLYCDRNQLTSLDVSKNTALIGLYCSGNQLTSLDVSKNATLTTLDCSGNQIKGASMDRLINSLPIRGEYPWGSFRVYSLPGANVCTKKQVKAAKEKGWIAYYKWNEYDWREYEGSEDIPTAIVEINATNFPDENFRNYLLQQDYGKDGILTDVEIMDITHLYIWGNEGIRSLQGIEYFTALTTLVCENNKQQISLDVSKNTALTSLSCRYNQLTALDVSKNTILTKLDCSYNQLTALDVSKNTTLTMLNCYDNQLTALDVSKNTALTELNCFYNQLTALDVSKNTALTWLGCGENQLTALDVSKNTALTSLDCSHNQLTALDVSGCTALTSLDCHDNQLTALNVSGCTALTSLGCHINQIKGASMDNLIKSLPINNDGYWQPFYVYSSLSPDEGNVCTKKQVQAAKEKGWIACYQHDEYGWRDYEGSDDTSAIDDIKTEASKDAPVYNLRGQRLTAPQKGVNIIGGRKVVVK